MAPVQFSVVRANRTERGVTRDGWAVERAEGQRRSHFSVLFRTEAEAKIECLRLEKLENPNA
jgi:hypothetical protein